MHFIHLNAQQCNKKKKWINEWKNHQNKYIFYASLWQFQIFHTLTDASDSEGRVFTISRHTHFHETSSGAQRYVFIYFSNVQMNKMFFNEKENRINFSN